MTITGQIEDRERKMAFCEKNVLCPDCRYLAAMSGDNLHTARSVTELRPRTTWSFD
jgi:hypothetical protein